MSEEIRNRLTPEYIAGFFDGEGCVQLYWCAGQVWSSIQISQKDQRPLLDIQARYGGKIDIRKNGTGALRLIGRKRIEKFLKEVGPFIKYKQNQCKLLSFALRLRKYLRRRRGRLIDRGMDLIIEEMKKQKRSFDVPVTI